MDPRPEPVFILCPARSLSTVSTAVLGGHPGVFALPEMLVFTAPTVGEVLKEQHRRPSLPEAWVESRISGILRAIAQIHEGDQGPEAIDRARGWLRQHSDWAMTELLDHVLEGVRPLVGLEKSPDTAGTDQSLAACLAAYPRARYIHLVRHPVSTQRSMHKHWGDFYNSRREVVATSATAWYLGHRRIDRALATLPPEQWIRLRAEDLLREPTAVLPGVLDWLSLSTAPEIVARMTRTEHWTFAGVGSGSDLYGGDPSFLQSPALRPVARPGPVRFDPEWGLPEEMCRPMARLAEALGYRPDGDV
jgi:hypothetical protein